MLTRSRRLRTAKDFGAAWRSRWMVRGSGLAIRVVPRSGDKQRIGFVIPKTTAKKAVDRNLLKRRLRALSAKITWPAGHDLMVVAYPQATKLNFTELSHVFHQLIDQAFTSRDRRRAN